MFSKYAIDTKGRIFNERGMELGMSDCCRGYRKVLLRDKETGRKRCYYIHQLVAYNFIPRTDPKKNQVDHINGIKHDNRIENLEWVDNTENMRRATANGLRPKGEKSGNNKYRESLIRKVIYDLYVKRDLVSAISNRYHVHEHTVRAIRDHEYWTWLIDEILKENGLEGLDISHKRKRIS